MMKDHNKMLEQKEKISKISNEIKVKSKNTSKIKKTMDSISFLQDKDNYHQAIKSKLIQLRISRISI